MSRTAVLRLPLCRRHGRANARGPAGVAQVVRGAAFFVPAFEYHHGKLPAGPNELQESGRPGPRRPCAPRQAGVCRPNPPGNHVAALPQARGHRRWTSPPSRRFSRALLTRGDVPGRVSTFTNGSRGVWKVDFRATPGRIAITIFGPLPDSAEVRAWLTPLLTIHGAKEAFQQWPAEHAGQGDPPVEIEYTHQEDMP